MKFDHGSTTTGINNILHYQDQNHSHYSMFYREMCDFLDDQFGNDGHGWYRGVRPQPRGGLRGGSGHLVILLVDNCFHNILHALSYQTFSCLFILLALSCANLVLSFP